MMHSAITVFFPAPAMFGAGRQPLASIHSNTSKPGNAKNKRSVKGKKADVFLAPATSTHTNCVGTCDPSADDDIPLALLKQFRLASLTTRSSTLQRGTAVRRKAVELDLNSESPLTRLLMKYTPLPAPEAVTLRQPRVESRKPALHAIPVQPKKDTILYPVGRVRPMMCIVPDCPHDWHIHLNPSNL